ncbi:PIN domain-containing protein [Leadbettera azotonutricia]|uniref:PIN domain protein n=1 Tax=Leadbettera azotonutricia (strain ATCC BAA-888 / DSM 13862 / ZAS-9) TaxID=545695 RepID=F5YC72_LEAAZ|nr:PIN domain-containing protein [Leadbettera azotonutricia]AEF81968.1 PIN domain protein [Leadbettera azotonutricia ZAS-9]
MKSILIDSSAWIEYFRGNEKYRYIKNLIYSNITCTNDLILTELLPSIIHRKEKHLEELLNRLTKYEMKINWNELQEIQVMNYTHGYNNIGITDLMIAQNCLQNNLKIIAQDKHFNEMAEYIPIRIYEQDKV